MKKLIKFILMIVAIVLVLLFLSNQGIINTHLFPTMEFTNVEDSLTKTTAYVKIKRCDSKTFLVDDFSIKFNNVKYPAIDIRNTDNGDYSTNAISITSDKEQILKIEFLIIVDTSRFHATLYYKGQEIDIGKQINI